MLFSGCAKFSAPELLHRRVCHKSTEASVVDIDGTSYVLPPCSEFLLSNLQDFCDHLYLELAGMAFHMFAWLCVCVEGSGGRWVRVCVCVYNRYKMKYIVTLV